MQKQNTGMTYIPVPTELLEEADIATSDVMQMHVDNGRLIVERLEKIKEQPLADPSRWQDYELCQFLTALRSSQQHKAMIYLTLMWAEKQFNQSLKGELE